MNPERIKKYRLESGSVAISQNLEKLELDEMIIELYLPVKDLNAKKLYSFYEQMFIKARKNKELFVEKIYYEEQQKIIKWIRENNHWKLFADFSMYVSRNVQDKNRILFIALMSAMMDTWATIAPYGYYWYGLNEKGQPLYVKELYGAYDAVGYEMFEKMQRDKRNGNFTAKKEVEFILKTELLDKAIREKQDSERNITNIISDMVGLIDLENQDFIYPKKWANHYRIASYFPRQWKPNDFYWDMLDSRSFLLDSEGVIVDCFNAGLFQQIKLKEEFLEDGLVLLFNVVNNLDNGETMGFIDLRNRYAFSAFKYSDQALYHNKFINFILEVYAKLTCDFEVKTNRFVSLKLIENQSELNSLNVGQPAIYCKLNEQIESSTPSSHRKVTQKIFHKVKPFLRKGNASEMAIANARMYGIILPAGYTFVREHTRGKKGDF